MGGPQAGGRDIEQDRHQLPPAGGVVLLCSTGGRADAAMQRDPGSDIRWINCIIRAINCI